MAAKKINKLNPSVAVLKRDPRFAKLIKKHGPVVREQRGDPFASLVRSIVYQQVSGKAAATILARFVALFDAQIKNRKNKFPTPEEVSNISIEKLRLAGLSGQKASYIKDLAEKFTDGTIKHTELSKMNSDEVLAHLVQVKGVGRWTVQMFLISTLGRPDILPVGDLGIQKGFQIVYGLKKLPSSEQMERLAKPWRAHASAASWYLWRAADEAKLIIKIPKSAPKALKPRYTIK